MATIKSYTDLEQSKKLAKILPLESADMWWVALNWQETEYYVEVKQDGINQPKKAVPCWSLASLLDVLPEGARLLKATNISSVGDIKYHCDYPRGNSDVWFDNPVDACYNLILKLNELNLL